MPTYDYELCLNSTRCTIVSSATSGVTLSPLLAGLHELSVRVESVGVSLQRTRGSFLQMPPRP